MKKSKFIILILALLGITSAFAQNPTPKKPGLLGKVLGETVTKSVDTAKVANTAKQIDKAGDWLSEQGRKAAVNAGDVLGWNFPTKAVFGKDTVAFTGILAGAPEANDDTLKIAYRFGNHIVFVHGERTKGVDDKDKAIDVLAYGLAHRSFVAKTDTVKTDALTAEAAKIELRREKPTLATKKVSDAEGFWLKDSDGGVQIFFRSPIEVAKEEAEAKKAAKAADKEARAKAKADEAEKLKAKSKARQKD